MLEVTVGSMLNSRIEFLKRVLKNQQDTGVPTDTYGDLARDGYDYDDDDDDDDGRS